MKNLPGHFSLPSLAVGARHLRGRAIWFHSLSSNQPLETEVQDALGYADPLLQGRAWAEDTCFLPPMSTVGVGGSDAGWLHSGTN